MLSVNPDVWSFIDNPAYLQGSAESLDFSVGLWPVSQRAHSGYSQDSAQTIEEFKFKWRPTVCLEVQRRAVNHERSADGLNCDGDYWYCNGSASESSDERDNAYMAMTRGQRPNCAAIDKGGTLGWSWEGANECVVVAVNIGRLAKQAGSNPSADIALHTRTDETVRYHSGGCHNVLMEVCAMCRASGCMGAVHLGSRRIRDKLMIVAWTCVQ